MGEASLEKGATPPPPCPARGARSGPAPTQVAAQRCWMVVPSGVEQGRRSERGERQGAAWGPLCPSPPVLVRAGGALHPQQPSASPGSRHIHHEREHQSLARKDPSQERQTDMQAVLLLASKHKQCTFLCRSSFLRCSNWNSTFSSSASPSHSSVVACCGCPTPCRRGSAGGRARARLLLGSPCVKGWKEGEV